MKKKKNILSHLFSNPIKLQEHKCLNRLKALLPKRFQQSLVSIYKKGHILYFVFNHQGLVMEFNYIKKDINELLKMVQMHDKNCTLLEIKQIKSYAKFQTKAPTQKQKSIQRYRERSRATFEIVPSNPELKMLLQKIKEAIKKNGRS